MKKFFLWWSAAGLWMNGIAQKKIIVVKDGSGNYNTVQAAFNSIPLNNKKPVTIYIKNGIYKEKLLLDSSKNFVTLEGEDKFNTILTYDDHTGKVSPRGDTINTRTSWSCKIVSDHFTAGGITFRNTAGFNAGQAVAMEAIREGAQKRAGQSMPEVHLGPWSSRRR